MLKILKSEQRPRRKGKLFEMLSFLPYYGGYVKPFGDLVGIEEVVVSPGGELFPDNVETEILFLGREGSLAFHQEDSEPEFLVKNSCLISRPDSSEFIFGNSREYGISRFITLGFRPGEKTVPPGSVDRSSFNIRGNRTVLMTLASGSSVENSLQLSLDAEVSLARIGKEEKLIFETQPSRRILMAVLDGFVGAEKNSFRKNDSLMVMGEPEISLYAYEMATVLIVDLPEYKSPFVEEQEAEEEARRQAEKQAERQAQRQQAQRQAERQAEKRPERKPERTGQKPWGKTFPGKR